MPSSRDFRMDSNRPKRGLQRWCGILLVLASLSGVSWMAAEKGKPLSDKEVAELLSGSVPNSEIARVVAENGIGFHLSSALEKQFRDLGATDELIDALRKASLPETTPPPPSAKGMLKIRSQPGEAQVYVNDEPKGITSPEGDLKLSDLDPGTYRVRVALAGYKTWENSLDVTAGETATAFVTLEKQSLAPTVILDADHSSIQRGDTVYLRWTSVNATDVDIEPGVGKVALTGSTGVTPSESTNYTLTAIGPGGIKTATTYVAVTVPPPPPPAPVVQQVVGNLPGFPVPGASLKAIRFYESGPTIPPLNERSYQAQFRGRNTRFIDWELDVTSPPVANRVAFTIYATWYSPTGTVITNQTVSTAAEAGWTDQAYTSGRGWQRPGFWKRGTYRVDLFVNGNRIASASFGVY
jgi:hypothetical protein